MPATERLYYNDSHLIEFEARVTDKTDRVSGWTAVTLDRTAFYPTGGGQPSDTGTLDGLRVVECIDDEENGVLHVIQGRAPEVGATVKGQSRLAAAPRPHSTTHRPAHSLAGFRHSLQRADARLSRAERVCEIDVELTNPTNEVIERAVELANNVIWEDRADHDQDRDAEEAAQLAAAKRAFARRRVAVDRN